MNFTQKQIDTIQLPLRRKRIRLEVLNRDFQTLAVLEGNAIGGSLQKDATSFVRRTGSIQMCVPSYLSAKTFLDYVDGITVNINGKIWLDKYIKIKIGIDNSSQTVWYDFGICLIDSPVRSFGSDGYMLSFSVIDLAAKLNGQRSGQLALISTTFPRVQGYDTQGNAIYSPTEEAIATCISQLTEFKRYSIYPIPQKWAVLPYDINADVGATVYSLLEQFLNILSGWQMYFDNNGVFVVEPIPNGLSDIVYPLEYSFMTNDTNSANFNNVRNQIIVYGKSHNITHYPDSFEWDTLGNLTLKFENFDKTKARVGSTVFGWTNAISDIGGHAIGHSLFSISIIDLSTNETVVDKKPIYWYESPNVPIENLTAGLYVFRIKTATTRQSGETREIDFTQFMTFELLGLQQSQACIVEGNPESPYYINKDYKVGAHYGETIFVGGGGGSAYEYYYIELTDIWDNPQVGEILTFFSRHDAISSGEYTQYYIYNKNEYGTETIFGDYALLKNPKNISAGGDYSVWECKYVGIENGHPTFELIGRCPYANTLVLSGGEYDNIYADKLAKERAIYELYLHSNLQNTVTLSGVPDYLLDVNYKIKYNQKNAVSPNAQSKFTFEDKYFLTKQVTYPLGLDSSNQSINAIEIYNDYNYVGNAYDNVLVKFVVNDSSFGSVSETTLFVENGAVAIVTGIGQLTVGTTVVTATANSGCLFDGWYVGDSEDPMMTQATIVKNTTITAKFHAI